MKRKISEVYHATPNVSNVSNVVNGPEVMTDMASVKTEDQIDEENVEEENEDGSEEEVEDDPERIELKKHFELQYKLEEAIQEDDYLETTLIIDKWSHLISKSGWPKKQDKYYFFTTLMACHETYWKARAQPIIPSIVLYGNLCQIFFKLRRDFDAVVMHRKAQLLALEMIRRGQEGQDEVSSDDVHFVLRVLLQEMATVMMMDCLTRIGEWHKFEDFTSKLIRWARPKIKYTKLWEIHKRHAYVMTKYITKTKRKEIIQDLKLILRHYETTNERKYECMFNIALHHEAMENFDSALKTFDGVLSQAKDFSRATYRIGAKYHVGRIHFELKDYVKAKRFLFESLTEYVTIFRKNYRKLGFMSPFYSMDACYVRDGYNVQKMLEMIVSCYVQLNEKKPSYLWEETKTNELRQIKKIVIESKHEGQDGRHKLDACEAWLLLIRKEYFDFDSKSIYIAKAENWKDKGTVYQVIEHYEKAFPLITSEREKEEMAHEMYKYYFKFMKYPEEAIDIIQKCRFWQVRLDVQVGLVLVTQRKYEEALEILEVTNNPDERNWPGIKMQLGMCYLYLGQLEKAEENLLQANYREAAIYLLHYYMKTKQNDKAEAILKRFRQQGDKYIYNMGETMFKVLDVIHRTVMGKAVFVYYGKMFPFFAGFNELARALVLCDKEERSIFYDAYFDYVKREHGNDAKAMCKSSLLTTVHIMSKQPMTIWGY